MNMNTEVNPCEPTKSDERLKSLIRLHLDTPKPISTKVPKEFETVMKAVQTIIKISSEDKLSFDKLQDIKACAKHISNFLENFHWKNLIKTNTVVKKINDNFSASRQEEHKKKVMNLNKRCDEMSAKLKKYKTLLTETDNEKRAVFSILRAEFSFDEEKMKKLYFHLNRR